MKLARVVVRLHEECVKFGGRNEYPDGKSGVESVPGDATLQAYTASAPYRSEGLRYVRFGTPFTVVVDTQHRGVQVVTKTDKDYGMWIPHTLLKPVRVAPTAMTN